MTEYSVSLGYQNYHLSIQDNKECIIVSDTSVKKGGGVRSRTNKEAFDEVSSSIRLTYDGYTCTCIINIPTETINKLRAQFIVVILRIEFPSLKCCDLYNHILTNDYIHYDFNDKLKYFVEPPECYNHEMYMSKIKTLLSDIDIDFINGTYSVNYKGLLSKYVPNVICDIIISYSYS